MFEAPGQPDDSVTLQTDGGDIATGDDRHPQKWHLRLYRDSVDASSLVAETMSDYTLKVSKLFSLAS